ncbi:hypothetical protein QBC38DRAFT_283301 [Podospora fimiseda]|uniref:Uncharacterized protein n=1 Tax=Podospora fimiseda TaxID=252190 RepID=A0AAN7BKE1_9PEZI|nr:hypothetical protein QBC38DRAFT_283301 [Podospora fimiseda]
MAPNHTGTSHNGSFRPYPLPNLSSHAVSATNLDEGDIWHNIPVDFNENEDSHPVQHWQDHQAGRWIATPIYLDTPDIFRSMLPTPQIDAVWTNEHELRLQRDWKNHTLRKALLHTRSHQFAGHALQQPAVAHEERTLWENTCFYFGCPPSDIISTQHRMMVTPDKVHNHRRTVPKVEGRGAVVQSILWGFVFCQNLNDILLHPIWEGRPALLREAIKYTVVCVSVDDPRHESPLAAVARVECPSSRRHEDLDTGPPWQPSQMQLLYQAIDLVAKTQVHRDGKDKKEMAGSDNNKNVYLVRASDIAVLTTALEWSDFWASKADTAPSSAWKGVARRLAKPWRMLTDEDEDYGIDQLYLDVLRQTRRWALED